MTRTERTRHALALRDAHLRDYTIMSDLTWRRYWRERAERKVREYYSQWRAKNRLHIRDQAQAYRDNRRSKAT